MKTLHFTVKTAKSWATLLRHYKKYADKSFIFRGQVIDKRPDNQKYKLITSFEQALCDMAGKSIDKLDQLLAEGREKIETWQLEEGLLREFQRKCSLYLEDTPRRNDRMEWLSLMRHYGAPTRIIDWTYSFYSALFMALDRPFPRNTEDTIIWALDTHWLKKRVQEKCEFNDSDVWTHLDNDPHIEKLRNWKLFFGGEYDFVYPVAPFRLNARLTIQQGLFLCQGNISIPFQDNLAALQEGDSNARQHLIAIRLDLTPPKRVKYLKELYRMNMTKANLYPGLQGFAESLKMRLIFPKQVGGPIKKDPA